MPACNLRGKKKCNSQTRKCHQHENAEKAGDAGPRFVARLEVDDAERLTITLDRLRPLDALAGHAQPDRRRRQAAARTLPGARRRHRFCRSPSRLPRPAPAGSPAARRDCAPPPRDRRTPAPGRSRARELAPRWTDPPPRILRYTLRSCVSMAAPATHNRNARRQQHDPHEFSAHRCRVRWALPRSSAPAARPERRFHPAASRRCIRACTPRSPHSLVERAFRSRSQRPAACSHRATADDRRVPAPRRPAIPS